MQTRRASRLALLSDKGRASRTGLAESQNVTAAGTLNDGVYTYSYRFQRTSSRKRWTIRIRSYKGGDGALHHFGLDSGRKERGEKRD